MTYKKPVLLVGNGVRTASAADLVYEFARKTHIPVVTTMNGADLVQDNIRIGFIGTYGNRIANMIISECDLLISVGARLGLRQVGHVRNQFAPKAKLIRAEIDPNELSRTIKDDEEKHLQDASAFLKELLAKEIPDYSDWFNRCMSAKHILDGYDNTEGNNAVEEIAKFLPENPMVCIDVGQHQCWCAQSLTLRGNKGRMLFSGGYGSMGCSLPYSIGASIATSHGTVYCITGDGGLQMNIQELESVVRENLPIKIIVLNNHVLGKISEIQAGSYDHRYAQTTARSGYSVPDFEKIATAYGLKAATISSYKELSNYALWMRDDEPCLINISIPEDTLLIPKIKWETGKIMPELEPKLLDEVMQLLDF